MISFPRVCWLLAAVTFLIATLRPVQAAEIPEIGAQVWIEPGQTPQQIDGWFATLESSHMPVARLFLMWSYLQTAPATWDFSLYDVAFRAAEKHHVRIVATLTPTGEPPFLGGDGTQGVGVPRTTQQAAAALTYIRKVVERYRSSSALDTWLLMNEPGQPPEDTPLAVTGFRQWLRTRYQTVRAVNIAWDTNYADYGDITPDTSANAWNRQKLMDWTTFWRSFQTAQLRNLAQQVRALDPDHPLHVNPHALLSNLAGLSDDLPAWRGFIDSLGCSIHPAWHFSLLKPDQFALGVSYINDLVAGSIEPKPHWVTELQGGDNIYSGIRPMDPTPDEIAQWTWTSIGAHAQRVIYWLLNARRRGVEAGEWSLLDFGQLPSERLTTAARIARTIDENRGFFADSHIVLPDITLIVSLDTMTYEMAFARTDYPGRGRNAQLLETLGLYSALSELGPPPAVRHFDDYAWEQKTAAPRVAVLPDVRVLTLPQIERLKSFVRNGNTLVVTGLTGMYNTDGGAWPLLGFPLSQVTGGSLKEVFFKENLFPFSVEPSNAILTPRLLPSHLWFGSIEVTDGNALGREGDAVTAMERRVNGGKVVWIPTPIGMGAWLENAAPLANYMRTLLVAQYAEQPFRFASPQQSCILRVLESSRGYTTVVTNSTQQPASCRLLAPKSTEPTAVWGPQPGVVAGQIELPLQPLGTSVLLWPRQPAD
jgi:beta-galactosidase